MLLQCLGSQVNLHMDFNLDAAKLRRLEKATNLGCQYFLPRDKTSHSHSLNQRFVLPMTYPILSDANLWLGLASKLAECPQYQSRI